MEHFSLFGLYEVRFVRENSRDRFELTAAKLGGGQREMISVWLKMKKWLV